MTDFPFGFGKPDDEGDGAQGGPSGSSGQPPMGAGAFNFGFPAGADIGEALHRFADMLSWEGGPVNWDLAKDVARQAASGDDPTVSDADREKVEAAVRLAELWLDPATSFPSATTTAHAWSRAEWIETTLPTWKTLVEPVATKVVDAFGGELGSGLMAGLSGGSPDDPELSGDLPAEVQQMAGPLMSMMRQMGGVMFGGQVGQALGTLAREVVSSTDIGLPLAGTGQAALLPASIATFGEGLGLPQDEVRLFLALREAAAHRLFGAVPWLRPRVIAAIEDYARGITIDTDNLQQAIGSIDPSNPQAVQEALAGGLFTPQNTPAQVVALTRLETLLALIEGWIDDVVGEAARERLAGAAALGETVRRRRASGGPAEQTFGTLVGLELRPRRMREAAQLWRALRDARGVEGRDALWEHPDLLPNADDLDDPQGFVDRRDIDLDLGALDDAPEAPPGSDDPNGGRPDQPGDAAE